MKLGRYNITLSKEAPPKTTGVEQGGSAGAVTPGGLSFDYALGVRKDPSIPQIMMMIDNDGTAQGLYSFLTFAAQATNWHLEPDPEDVVKNSDGTESHPQAEFAEACLRNPEHKGGMSTPFSLVLEDILLGIAQGHRFFEIVYKLNDDGQVVFKKIAARDWNEYEIITDDTGGFAGVEQRVKKGNAWQKVTIELPYCFLYTYNKARNKLYGRSAFRAGYYHYDKKHRLYYLQNQQAQTSAVTPKVVEQSGENQFEKQELDDVVSAVDQLGTRATVGLPFGLKLSWQPTSKSIDLQPGIDGHDVQMARAVLAQGMMQGNSSQTDGGSYALGQVHFDAFMLAEVALMTSIEEHVTTYLLSKLHDYNFDKPLYSTFKFEALSDPVQDLLRTAFEGMVTKGTVPDWVAAGISEKVAEQMEIEKPDDAEEQDQSQGDNNNDSSSNNGNPSNRDNGDGSAGTKKVEQSRKRRFAKGTWWRELTAPEAKVQFTAIQKAADAAESAMVADLKPIFQKLSDDTRKRLEPLLASQGVKALDGFTLKFDAEVRQVMTDAMLDAYSKAKTGAADELGVAAPANKQSSKDMIKQHVAAIVEKQYGDMLFNLKTIVTDAVRKNQLARTELSIANILALIASMISTYFDEKEGITSGAIITAALNIGRDDVFKDRDDDIYGYQYSAILDEKVCPICQDLDGNIVTGAEYAATKWMPPIHFNCRCIWVAIMNDEDDKPDFTGLPDAPGGTNEPTLSRTGRGK